VELRAEEKARPLHACAIMECCDQHEGIEMATMRGWVRTGLILSIFLLPLQVSAEEMEAAFVEGDETFLAGYSCVAPPAGSSAPILCEARISQILPPFYFEIAWHRVEESGERAITRIAIRRQGEAEPFQIISDVESSANSEIENNGFEVMDLNFDGHLDFRLLAQTTTGPNVLYRNWLWSNRDMRFVSHATLDEIVSPEFDPDTQEITSRWRASVAEGGVDIYAWEGGSPVLIHRETDRYEDAGCTRFFYDRIGGRLEPTGEGPCA
jgi:hypothetical protein